jgi:hypothetical protein
MMRDSGDTSPTPPSRLHGIIAIGIDVSERMIISPSGFLRLLPGRYGEARR